MPDSLKGSCNARLAANAIEEGLLSSNSTRRIKTIPMADGGEGTMETISSLLGGKYISTTACDPLGRKRKTKYLQLPDRETAVIESAETCGLTLLSKEERNPMRTTSAGLGEQIKAAYGNGIKNFIIGLGGSATCDAGKGMLSVLSTEWLLRLQDCTFTILCDVENPLCGADGAAAVFAPQKGASPEEVKILEDDLYQFALSYGKEQAFFAKTGAAGGLGYAFLTFFHANLLSGINYLLNLSQFDSLVKDVDLIITAEGCSDLQTLSGKVPFGILQKAKKVNVPVVVLAGAIKNKNELLSAGFADVVCINQEQANHPLLMQTAYTKHRLYMCAKNLDIERYIQQ